MSNSTSPRESFDEGNVVLTQFLPADKSGKYRPAVVLRKIQPFNDFICCALSSQLRHHVEGVDEVIHPDDEDFERSGLHVASLVRVGFVGTYGVEDLRARLGSISAERHMRLLSHLSTLISP